MNELTVAFIFLLPIAWYFGYRHGKKREKGNSSGRQQGLSKTYFTGLNYLLNEESDKAIDTFVSMLEIDSETVETHLALGNLFRKRGEVNRAIRIHQNLIARPSLSSQDRKLALLELGYDYMGAGLLDRAENIFNELASDDQHKNAGLSQLLIIHQQTRDWQQAIAVAAQLHYPQNEKSNKNDHIKTEMSHFYCELANEALSKHLYSEALNWVKKASQTDPRCVRSTLISADIHYANGRFKQAIKCYKNLAKQEIAFLTEAIEPVINCFVRLNDEKGLLDFLHRAVQQGGGISLVLAYAEILQRQQDDRTAAQFITDQMKQHPSLKGLQKLIELHIEHASDSAKPSLMLLQDIVFKLLKNIAIYRCEHCGFNSKTLFWQCPSCKHWGLVKPIQGIQGE